MEKYFTFKVDLLIIFHHAPFFTSQTCQAPCVLGVYIVLQTHLSFDIFSININFDFNL